jgi:hypothetical protein
MKMMRTFVAVMAVVTTFNALLAVSKAESVEGLDKFMGVLMHAIPVGELAPTFAPLGNMTRYEFKGKDGSGTRSVIRVIAYHQHGTVQWTIIHDDATGNSTAPAMQSTSMQRLSPRLDLLKLPLPKMRQSSKTPSQSLRAQPGSV